MKRLAFVGCRYNTAECISQVLADGFDVHRLITIDESTARKNLVSGYMDLRPFADAHSIPVTTASNYSLRDADDRARLAELDLDIALVIGWQRLLPGWFLAQLSIGAFGMHGSPDPLPAGRGRSPQNWSLILGRNRFITNLFRYDEGVDSGAIVGSQVFDVNAWDDIYSLHLKNRLAMNQLLRRHLPELLAGSARFNPQPAETPTYYPKRTPADGIIDWAMTTRELYNFCRGLTRPYPGAFSFVDGHIVRLWRVVPFDTQLSLPGEPGEILVVADAGEMVVRTVDGTLLIREWQSDDGYRPRVGDRLQAPAEYAARLSRWRTMEIPGPAPR